MAVPTYPNAITLADIQTEFGGSNPIGLNEYYSGGTYVGSGIANSTGTVIPTSGAINFLNFSGAVSYITDPIQPTVSATYWHGTFSGWSSGYPSNIFISRTGHVHMVSADAGRTSFVLDAAGVKVHAANIATGGAYNYGYPPIPKVSWKNPYYIYGITFDTGSRYTVYKMGNTASSIVAAANSNWGASNTGFLTTGFVATSGSDELNTRAYILSSSNGNWSNATHTLAALNSSNLTQIMWSKSVNVTAADPNSNLKGAYIWTNPSETELFYVGGVGSNTGVVIINIPSGSVANTWKTAASLTPILQPTAANNIAFRSSYTLYMKANTGANVIGMTISNTSWRESSAYASDIDYDSNIYLSAHYAFAQYAMVAKYNSSGTQQWQIRIRCTNAANAVYVQDIAASNSRVILSLREVTWTYDGKKWYQSGYGTPRIISISSASGNTGTFGQFVFETNTNSTFGTTTNPGLWSLSYNPVLNNSPMIMEARTVTIASNGASFSRTTF